MTGICVENCALLLLSSFDKREAGVYFNKGDIVEIGKGIVRVGGDGYAVLSKENADGFTFNEYLIKEADRDKFFKRVAGEAVQCSVLPAMNEMNAFLKGIEPDKIVSSGVDSTGCWVYYKTFVEKGWEE